MAEIIDQDQWGICGFVSVLNGLRTAGLLTKMTANGARAMSLDEIQTQLYAEIVAYLKYLVFTTSPLVQQIEKLSFHLAPKGEPKRNIFQLVQFIEGRLRTIAGVKGRDEESIRQGMRRLIANMKKRNQVTIAMTPDALVDYLQWTGVKNAMNLQITTTMNTGENLLAHKNCIIGIGGKQGAKALCNGLEHWIYVDGNGVLNNWGTKTQLQSGHSGVNLFGKWAIFITHVIKMA
jgi:hypothetical protein